MAAAWNFKPRFVFGIKGISIVFSIEVLDAFQEPSSLAASILSNSCSALSLG